MIDWHCHILPVIDDGAADMDQSVAMASALLAAGYDTVYCTPHYMRGSYEAGNDVVRAKVKELQDRLDREQISLKVIPGREYCLDEFLAEQLEDPLTLGTSRQVLIELLPHISDDMVRHVMYGVVRAGFVPVVAHPERSPQLAIRGSKMVRRGLLAKLSNLFTRADSGECSQLMDGSTGNELLDYLRDIGCCFQGNLGSFTGCYGSRVMSIAYSMKQIGLYDRFGSDLHSPADIEVILEHDRS